MAHRRLNRAGLLISGSMLVALAVTSAAKAQSIPPAPAPPSRSPVDDNGVNVATGQVQMPTAELAIGPLTPGQLKYVGYTFGANSLNSNTIAISSSGQVILGSVGKSFSGGIATDGSGDKLVSTTSGITYVARDGTIITFSNSMLGTGTGNLYINVYAGGLVNFLATSITYPNGEKVALNYRIDSSSSPSGAGFQIFTKYIRIQSVTSNRGYQLKYNYANNANGDQFTAPTWLNLTSVTGVNNAVDYCAPTVDSCSGLTASWPSLSFSVSGTVTSITDPANGVTSITRDSSGRIVGIRRPTASADNVTIAYDGSGRVSSVTKDGVTYGYSFSLSGATMTGILTGPNGTIRTTVANTTTGSVTSVTDALNRQTAYQPDSFGRVTQVTYPEGNYDTFTYDDRGNVTQKTSVAKAGSGLANIVTSAGYDATCTNAATCNQPNWTRDAKNNQTDFTYDATHGGLLTVTAPAATSGATRPQTRFSYTRLQAYYKNGTGSIVASGVPIYLQTGSTTCQTLASCTSTADEIRTAVDYGPQIAGVANNLLPISKTKSAGDNSLSATVTYSHDPVGNQTTVDGPLAGAADTTRIRYDAARRVVGVVSPDPDGSGALLPRAERTTYDGDGKVTATELGTVTDQSDSAWAGFSSLQKFVTTYDVNARAVRQEVKSGGTTYAVTQYGYNNDGVLVCIAQRMDPAQWAGQSDSCTPQLTGPNGPDRVEQRGIDALGRVIDYHEAFGTAAASHEYVSFTPNGQIETVTDGEGNKTTYEYDGFDRLSKTRYPVTTVAAGTSSTTDYEQLGYDAASNVTSQRLRDGQTITYSYDNLNRVTSKNPPGDAYLDWSVGYGYDLLGRLTSAIGDGWAGNSFSYDALGRLLTEQNYNATTYHAYDLAGRQTRLTWSDGFYVDYDYNVTGDVTAIRENGATSGAGVLAIYLYDNLGRRDSVTRGNGTTTNYSYDAVSRLASFSQDLGGSAYDFTHGFTYNPAGQIASLTRSNDTYAWGGHYNVDRPYGVNGLNQMTTAGSTSLGYDGRGNLTSSGSSGYGYTAENRMSVAPGLALAYEPAGGQLLQFYTIGGVDMRFAWSGNQMISEFDQINVSTKNILRRYVPGPGVDEPVVWYEGSGTSDRRWLHADERGSVVAVSDGSGNAIAVNRYDEYGIPASTNIGRFQYTGQAWLPELGMYYYKARIYSPTLGRFMQTDPIGYEDGMNWYNYVGSDPINKTDPTGLERDDCPGCINVTGSRPSGPSSITSLPTMSGNFGPSRANPATIAAQLGRFGAKAPQNVQNVSAKLSEEEQEIENDKDTSICQIVKTRECWASAGVRRARRAAGQPVPPPNLQTGTKPNWSSRDIAAGVGIIGIVGGVICVIAEPCGAAVAMSLGLGGAAALLPQ